MNLSSVGRLSNRAAGRERFISDGGGPSRAMLPPIVLSEVALQPLDLLLTGASSAIAVYAAAASLASERNATFFLWIVMGGTFCSSLVVWLLGRSKLVLADAIAYTVVALIAAFGILTLNDLSPDPIYVGPLTMAGVLSWMLAMGSFTVWRDQTMLFQAVPAVALFGLIGCYDTFQASVIYFFAFLICQAILLARAHGRVMLRQARSSGSEALEMSAMRKGPWRWMAGPEWALASALSIVLVSAIGAPILRESASSFSGLVKYTPPVSPLTQSSLNNQAFNATRIGTGPNLLRNNAIMRVDIPQAMYLRGYAFGRYERGSWQPRTSPVALDNSDLTPASLAQADIADKQDVNFRIEPIELTNGIVPVPGELTDINPDSASVYVRNGAGSLVARSDAPYPPCEGHSLTFGGKSIVKDIDAIMSQMVPDYVQDDGLPADVVALAKQVTKDAKTDLEKAQAIEHAIARLAKYNLNAAATPSGVDPVSYFLFTSREGYCDLFASAMTVMARSMGLPARYVTGYYPFRDEQDSQGRYIIRQRDGHAWCEIFFKNAGWVVFDATDEAESVDGGGRGGTNDRPFWRTGWFLMIVLFSLGSGSIYFGRIAIGNFLRYRGSADFSQRHVLRAKRRLGTLVRKAYIGFERELKRAAKRPRAMGETIIEYTSVAQDRLGHRSAMAWDAASAFTSALYAPASVDDLAVASLESKVRALRRARRGPKS